MEMINAIDRFGVQPVLGRMLYRREALRWNYIQRIVQAVRQFDTVEDMGRFMRDNPELFRLAQKALKITDA